MKKWIILIGLALLLCTLASCAAKASYMDNVSCDELVKKAIAEMNAEARMIKDESGFMQEVLPKNNNVAEAAIYYAQDTNNIDELGIFRVMGDNSADWKQHLEAYLKNSLVENATWYDSYIPNETSKLRDAEVRVFGNYVVYAILNKHDKNAAFTAVQNALRAN